MRKRKFSFIKDSILLGVLRNFVEILSVIVVIMVENFVYYVSEEGGNNLIEKDVDN